MKVDLTEYTKWLKEKEVSENTLTNYIRGINLYFENYDEITKENLIDWKQKLLKTHKPKTVSIRFCAINSYMFFKGYPATVRVKMPVIQKKSYVENIISEEEFNLFKNKLLADKNYKWYLTIKMLGYTGLRASKHY